MTDQSSRYFEQVKASGRAFAFLGLLLGATGGVLTGVAIKGVIGDPVVEGMGAVVFYAMFGLSSLITMFVMLNYLMMTLTISEEQLDIKIGMKAVSLKHGDIAAVRVAATKSRMYRAMDQRSESVRKIAQMWTVLGVASGIEIDVLRADERSRAAGSDSASAAKPVTWFVGSSDAEALQERIQALVVPIESPEGDDDQQVEA